MIAAGLTLAPSAAVAVPGVQGNPMYSTDRLGGGVADHGSWYLIKAETTAATAADELGGLVFYDAHPSAERDLPLGTLWLRLLSEGNPAVAGREVTFSARGWSEKAQMGAVSASLEVFTLSQNVFALLLDVEGGTGLTLEANLVASLAGDAVASDSALQATIAAEERTFGLALAGSVPWSDLTTIPGNPDHASASVAVPADGAVVLVLAFADDPASAPASAAAAMAAAGAPDTWLATVEQDWQQHFASYPAPHTTEPELLALDRIAMTTLRMNEVGSVTAGGLRGMYPSKTHYNNFWLWDTAFQALAVSEVSSERAFEQLELIYGGQITDTADQEYGMIWNHVGAGGQPPPDLVALAPYSQSPAFGMALREVYDRSARGQAQKDQLLLSYEVGKRFMEWWFRRRDWDKDGLAESNGGWENGMDDSVRFGDTPGFLLPQFPADSPDFRPSINCVDINAWIYRYYVELASIARLLGKPDEAGELDAMAHDLATRIDVAFWDESRGAYFDYYYDKATRQKQFIQHRTPVSWWPLFVGAARDPRRISRVVDQIVDPAAFWLSTSIPTLAADDPLYDPGGYWNGPMWTNVTYATMIALWRYGYEAEAQELRARMLATAAARDGAWERYNTTTGDGVGAYQFGWSAALVIEALRNRHQADISTTAGDGPARARAGYLRRVRRTEDGVLLLEIEAEGGYEVPITTIESPTAIFTEEAVKISFADPLALVVNRKISLTLPAFQRATVTIEHDDGTREVQQLDAATGPLRIRAAVTDVVTIADFTESPDAGESSGESSDGGSSDGGSSSGASDTDASESVASQADDQGCGCRARPDQATGPWALAMLVLLRRRRSVRSAT